VESVAIDVPQATLDDLRERLARTRWPEGPLEGWDGGIDPAYLRTLAEHWLVGFDWRAQEAALNRFAQFRADVDGLLTNVMIYWATGTIDSSFLPYYDFTNSGAVTWMKEVFKQWVGSTSVPAGFARFPRDISQPPREWAERFFNVQRWTEMPQGGHFAALEEPERLVEDVRAFFRPLRAAVDSRSSSQLVERR
jgi:pimeloyl-ACP methyl ester carboxylesterase